jgi:tRNA(fMet)-specific endonuclease VapC
MSLYMLDTDTVSYLIRGTSPVLDARVARARPDELCISAITRGELLYGLKLKSGAHRLAKLVDQLLVRMQSLPWDDGCATHFASIAADLHKAGTPIGSMDALIAGHAMSVGAILVTNNARHFSRVTALQVENWSHDY